MFRNLLKSKIYGATVTQANTEYEGSITLDQDLIDATGLVEHEKVLVADLTNGERLETYVIPGERGSGIVCMNGAAAHKIKVGDRIIILAFALVPEDKIQTFEAVKVTVDLKNKVITK